MAKGRKPGTALDVGMGQGRNTIWLAQQGWDPTGFDPAEKAVALAQENAAKLGVRIHTEIKGSEDFDFGERRWDLILLSYVSLRGVEAKLMRALKPGGVVIVEGFHRDATKGRSIGGGVVFDTGELVKLFSGLRVVRYEEPVGKPDFGSGSMRLCGTAARGWTSNGRHPQCECASRAREVRRVPGRKLVSVRQPLENGVIVNWTRRSRLAAFFPTTYRPLQSRVLCWNGEVRISSHSCVLRGRALRLGSRSQPPAAFRGFPHCWHLQ